VTAAGHALSIRFCDELLRAIYRKVAESDMKVVACFTNS
jgi:hypothetical protein